jgi:cyanophycin synthetase
VNAGGTNEELAPGDPCVVHPDNVRLAIEAARVLSLDFAGIDLISADIAQSWLEVGALICEVNACPQMGGTNDPGLYQGVLARMFPSGAEIPAELLVVPAQPLEQERIKDRLLRECSGVPVSLASGLWIDGRRSTPAFKHSFDAAQSLLQRREAHYAICCMTANDIHQFGLPLRKWDAVRVVSDAVFTHEEAELLVGVRDWLQAAMPRA